MIHIVIQLNIVFLIGLKLLKTPKAYHPGSIERFEINYPPPPNKIFCLLYILSVALCAISLSDPDLTFSWIILQRKMIFSSRSKLWFSHSSFSRDDNFYFQ